MWNLHVGQLWRRNMIAANRGLRHLERLHRDTLRLSHTKVAEFQARGAVHLANTAAAHAREGRRTAREELATALGG